VNFDCSAVNQFTVTLVDPPPSYRHIIANVSSETCTGISTNPPQPNATYTITWTGPPGFVSTQRSSVLDAQGHAVDRQPITILGTYNVSVAVTSGGTTRTATGSITVGSGAGTCPAP
jgi:hypothetical protein